MNKLIQALGLSLIALFATSAWAGDVHNIVIHLDENDPKRMNLVLNNVANINSYYADKGEESKIEVVAYGPGLNMYIKGKSPVTDRIASFRQNFDNVAFKACGNTKRKMSKKAGKEITLLSGVDVVPSGAIHLIERQEQGWSYLRP